MFTWSGGSIDSFVRLTGCEPFERGRSLSATCDRVVAAPLAQRTVRHKSGCPKCARGEGHQVHVLTVSYAAGRVRQLSVRRERVAEVRRWLENYQKLKDAIEAICELNHDRSRPDAAVPRGGRKKRD